MKYRKFECEICKVTWLVTIPGDIPTPDREYLCPNCDMAILRLGDYETPQEALTTVELVEELAKREGVAEIVLGPESKYTSIYDNHSPALVEGPARILIITD